MLRSLPSDARWCGPSAVSILTGEPYQKVKSYFAFMRQEPYSEVQGIYIEEILLALGEYGYWAEQIPLERLMTLKTFMANRTFDQRANPLLIGFHKHVITTHMDWAADNWTLRPVPLDKFPKPNRRVIDAHIIRRRIN